MRTVNGRWAAVFGFGMAALLVAAAASAQTAPPPPAGPEAAAIRECLCLKGSMDRASAEMTAKRNGLDQIQDQLKQADAELNRERAALNVNDAQAVAAFRQKLEQRDALFRRSTGEIVADVAAAVQRYNDKVNAHNQSCANRPFDSVLSSQVQATLSCPAE